MPIDLSAERGFIFRITHVANLPWLFANGLHCANGLADPGFVPIGNPDLIGKRNTRAVPEPHGGTLADYVPFYFTPKSPMLFNIHTGYRGITQRANDEIAILVSSIPSLVDRTIPFVFTDRHAFTPFAAFSDDPAELAGMIDWGILRRHDFTRSDDYPDKVERYQAEALVRGHLPVNALLAVACASVATQQRIETMVQNAGLALRIIRRPNWYF
jgi:hypothetical protein